MLTRELCSPVLSPILSRLVKSESDVFKGQAIIHPGVDKLFSRVICVEKKRHLIKK